MFLHLICASIFDGSNIFAGFLTGIFRLQVQFECRFNFEARSLSGDWILIDRVDETVDIGSNDNQRKYDAPAVSVIILLNHFFLVHII